MVLSGSGNRCGIVQDSATRDIKQKISARCGFFCTVPVGVVSRLARHNTPNSLFRLHGVGLNEIHIISSTIYNNFVYYVYILQSSKKKNWLYKGSTSDLKRRVIEHNAGKNFSTAPYAPLKLIYYEAYLLKKRRGSARKVPKNKHGSSRNEKTVA